VGDEFPGDSTLARVSGMQLAKASSVQEHMADTSALRPADHSEKRQTIHLVG
jgi:hypothetical protein